MFISRESATLVFKNLIPFTPLIKTNSVCSNSGLYRPTSCFLILRHVFEGESIKENILFVHLLSQKRPNCLLDLSFFNAYKFGSVGSLYSNERVDDFSPI